MIFLGTGSRLQEGLQVSYLGLARCDICFIYSLGGHALCFIWYSCLHRVKSYYSHTTKLSANIYMFMCDF